MVFGDGWIFQDKKGFFLIDKVLPNNLMLHQLAYSNKRVLEAAISPHIEVDISTMLVDITLLALYFGPSFTTLLSRLV
jgi:hypothetical protein